LAQLLQEEWMDTSQWLVSKFVNTMRWSDQEVIEKRGGYTYFNIINWLNITAVCDFNKVVLFSVAVGYFCIQWRLHFKHEWPHSSHNIKQTTIGLISASCEYQGLICSELMPIYLGGNFLCVLHVFSIVIEHNSS
jgi:hypothetical protein